MTFASVLPYLTGPILGGLAIAFVHMLRALATRALAYAQTTRDKNDDIVAQRWLTRAMWLEVCVIFLVRYFVPSAFAPRRDPPPTGEGLDL